MRPRKIKPVRPRRSSAEALAERGPPSMASSRVLAMHFTGLLALVLLLYARTFAFGYTHLDDKNLILDNPAFISSLSSLPRCFTMPYLGNAIEGGAYYRPLVMASYVLDGSWNGTAPLAFHVSNVLLHVACCGLLLLLLRTFGFRSNVAFALAAVFAVHPALVETVAWVPGRNDSLLGVFFLASWLAFARWMRSGSPLALAGHVAGYALALLTKESAVVLPVVCAAYVLLVAPQSLALKRATLCFSWIAVSLVWFFVRRSVIGPNAAGGSLGHTLGVALRNAPVLLMALGKIVFPYKLAVIAIIQDTPWLPGAFATALLTVLVFRARNVRWRTVAFGGIFFALVVAPTLVVSDFLILENRLYLPAIGVLIVGAELLQHLPALSGRALAAAALPVTIVLAAMNYEYTASFRAPLPFAQAAVAQSPHSSLAHLNLGTALQRAGNEVEAEAHYHTVLRLNPNERVTNNNLALVCLHTGRLYEARAHLDREIALNPYYDTAYYNLGLVLERLGEHENAVRAWERAVELNSGNSAAVMSLYDDAVTRGDHSRTARFRTDLVRSGIVPPGDSLHLRSPVGGQSTTATTSEFPNHFRTGGEVSVSQVPNDVIVRAYEGALRRGPDNRAVRERFAEQCLRRRLPCAREQYEILARQEPSNSRYRDALGRL